MYMFMKVFFKTNLFMWFSYFQTQQLKSFIHDLYSQCLTQSLSKTTSFTNLEGVVFNF